MAETQSASDGGSDEETPFGISEDLVSTREHKVAGVSTVDFDGLLSVPLQLHEDLKNGCGGQLWPAGMVLAKYMLRYHRVGLRNKTMLVATSMCND